MYSDLEKIVSEVIEIKDTYYPDAKKHDQYLQIYPIYKNLYEHTKGDSKKLVELAI